MLTFLRAAASIAALLVIAFGFSETEDHAELFWLGCLAVAGALLAIAWWPRETRALPIFNRTLLRWSTIIVVVFAIISVQLVRIQVIDSSKTLARVGTLPNDEVVANPRERLQALEMQRGKILDREGRVLADTTQREDGTWQRTWPELSTAPLIGYYSPQIYGASNIEAEFDEYLSGEEGGNPAREWMAGILHEDRRGYDLGLTIDLDLQQLALEQLGDRIGAAIVMDPNSGAVLAMVGTPLFDPNRLYANEGQQTSEEIEAIQAYWAELNADANAPLVFRPTQGLYSPGSTFKTVTVSTYLDTGEGDNATIFRDEGILEIDGRIIEEANRPDPNQIAWTLEESYAWSLNIVFAQIGLEVGPQTLWDYAALFGFGEQIPFDTYTEVTQTASSRDALNNRALLADTAFGQGEILATPLQMALVVSAVVNQGELPRPYVVEKVLDENGETLETFGGDTWRRAMNAATANAVRELMLASTEYGYASGGAFEGATVGGKTGTAEVGAGEPHSWYTAFAEQDGRTLVVAVIVERGGPGSAAAMPIGTTLLQAALQGN